MTKEELTTKVTDNYADWIYISSTIRDKGKGDRDGKRNTQVDSYEGPFCYIRKDYDQL